MVEGPQHLPALYQIPQVARLLQLTGLNKPSKAL